MTASLQYLIDTNVISEIGRKVPHEKVLRFFDTVENESLSISVLTLGQLRKGAARKLLIDTAAADKIEAWIDAVETSYAERVLPVDVGVANVWASLSAQRSRPIIDTLLAATAIHHGLVMVTRNTYDVADTGVSLVNPWELQ